MLDKFPPWLIKLLSKIRSTLFPVLLCCVFFFASDVSAFAAYEPLPFAVEIHNYSEDSYIQYGSSSVQIDTNMSSQPKLVFDIVFPHAQYDSDLITYGLTFVAHSTELTSVKFVTKWFDINNNLVLTNNRTISSFPETSGATSVTISNSSSSNPPVNIRDVVRCHVTITWTSGGNRSETVLLSAFRRTSSGYDSANIVNAINNQTSVIGGKIDDTNDLIDNGNENTGALINDVSSANEQLNEIWGEYEEIEDGFIDDYESASADLVDDFTGFSWLGAGEAIIWVSERLSQIYVALGDFRMYILYPLLLGIAMLFIGRGQVIMNNLSRRWFNDE